MNIPLRHRCFTDCCNNWKKKYECKLRNFNGIKFEKNNKNATGLDLNKSKKIYIFVAVLHGRLSDFVLKCFMELTCIISFWGDIFE